MFDVHDCVYIHAVFKFSSVMHSFVYPTCHLEPQMKPVILAMAMMDKVKVRKYSTNIVSCFVFRWLCPGLLKIQHMHCHIIVWFLHTYTQHTPAHTHTHTHTHIHTHTHTHTHHTHAHKHSHFCTILADVGQVQAKGLEPVYSQSKYSVGEVASLTPDFTPDLRAAGCLAVDCRRWPPVPQPTQAQGVRWKMVDGRRPQYVVRWTYDGCNMSGAFR